MNAALGCGGVQGGSIDVKVGWSYTGFTTVLQLRNHGVDDEQV